ncbi:hypothetical protein DID88_002474 [Monilinia fructigena]|uniref:HIT domain-containing protein n=1 Tax=Monilinia fructigena TaxID=38457 RepID=A0A395INU5_9HELO|nr:hypothetical protein DID88_002474 [Monilinia fructigena]
MASQAACIFCKIIKGDIPSFKLYESEKVLAFLDINPLSRGHALVIPKFHGEKLVDIPDDQLQEILPVVKKLVVASGAENYNVLQNNGRIAHQEVDHIPKPSTEEGLVIGWPQQKNRHGKTKSTIRRNKSQDVNSQSAIHTLQKSTRKSHFTNKKSPEKKRQIFPSNSKSLRVKLTRSKSTLTESAVGSLTHS